MTEQSRLVVLSDEQWAVLGPLIDECRPRGKTEPVALWVLPTVATFFMVGTRAVWAHIVEANQPKP